MNLIEIKNICKTYKSGEVKTEALCSANLSIKEGDFIAIMGPSGSGKSTLMQILGFLDRPTAGQYFFQGNDVSKYSDNEISEIRNKEIGFVFQAFNLLPRTSVYENVELPLLYDPRKNNKKENEMRIKEALKAVDLENRMNYLSNQISGGQKQRVAIARSLVNNPKIIFADEPTGNLDSKSGKAIMQIFKNLNKQGKTIILVTHEKSIANYAKRIIHIEDGKIVKDQSL